MEIEDYNAGWLSDFEVWQHLQEQRDKRDKIANRIGRPVRMAENMQTVEFETIKYLQDKAGKATRSICTAKMEALLLYLKEVSLTKAEKLQLINLLPQSEVEFYLVPYSLVGDYHFH